MKKDRSRKSALTTVIFFIHKIIPVGRGSVTNTISRDLLSYTEQVTQNIGDIKIIRHLNHQSLIITEVNQFRGVKIPIM